MALDPDDSSSCGVLAAILCGPERVSGGLGFHRRPAGTFDGEGVRCGTGRRHHRPGHTLGRRRARPGTSPGRGSHHSSFHRGCLWERRGRNHDAQLVVRQQGDRGGRWVPAQQRDGRLHCEAGYTQFLRSGPGRGQRGGARQEDALRHDPHDREPSRRHALFRHRLPGGREDHHDGLSDHRQRGGLWDERRSGRERAPGPPPAPARPDHVRAGCPHANGPGGTGSPWACDG